jgi:hypothetical protein
MKLALKLLGLSIVCFVGWTALGTVAAVVTQWGG